MTEYEGISSPPTASSLTERVAEWATAYERGTFGSEFRKRGVKMIRDLAAELRAEQFFAVSKDKLVSVQAEEIESLRQRLKEAEDLLKRAHDEIPEPKMRRAILDFICPLGAITDADIKDAALHQQKEKV